MGDTTRTEGGLSRSGPRGSASRGLRRGTTLARYIIIDRLGGGGMGDVYSAWDEELRRRVALKVIRPREGTDARDRMLAEGRALARLRHPHVVAVHDAGVVDSDGETIVYVAMEHLEGMPGTDWLATAPSPAARRRVVLQCAEGLAAAHAQDLIHRDIKPSNVVVEPRDAGAWASLVDFGLATALGERAEVGGGTRAYMAPECLENGALADTRSDQWSLALMAAEVFSGTRAAHEDAVAGHIGACGAATAVLRRALHRDPGQRFASVERFAAALRHATERGRKRGWMLAAVAATAVGTVGVAAMLDAPPSCQDQLEAGRSRWAPRSVVGESLEGLRSQAPEVARSASSLMTTWSDRWDRQHLEACAATEAASRARAEACLHNEAQQVLALLAVGAEPVANEARWQILGGLARAVQANPCIPGAGRHFDHDPPALARAMALETASRFDEAFELAQQELEHSAETASPAVRARVHYRLASIERRRGELESSLRYGEQSMQLAAPAGASHTWARTLIERVETWIGLGDYDRALEAARLARPAVAAAGDAPDLLAYWHYIHGRALSSGADYAGSIEAHTQALEIRQQTGDHPLYVADSHRALGNVHMRMSSCEQAELHLRKAISLYAASLGPGSPSECYALSSLAQCQAQRGPLDAALATSRRASSRLRDTLGPESIELAKVLTMEGAILGGHGRYEASVAPFRRAAEIRVAALGPSHPETLVAQTNLAWLFLTLGDVDAAEPLLEDMMSLVDTNDKVVHPNPGSFFGAMAALADARGRLETAVTFGERALEAAEASPSAADPLTLATPLYNLAESQEKAGDVPGAHARYKRVWELLDAHPAGHQQPAWAPTNLALGRLSEGAEAQAFIDAAAKANPALADAETAPPSPTDKADG